jgi:hypothetical protein
VFSATSKIGVTERTALGKRRIAERIRKINGPIFIAQGDQQLDGVVDHQKIVDEILIPELKAAGKELEEMV